MAELLTGGDPSRFFQVGQAIGGESGLGTFVKDLTERAKKMDELNVASHLKTQQAVAEQQATMPGDVAQAIAIKQGEQNIHDASNPFHKLISDLVTPGSPPAGGGSPATSGGGTLRDALMRIKGQMTPGDSLKIGDDYTLGNPVESEGLRSAKAQAGGTRTVIDELEKLAKRAAASTPSDFTGQMGSAIFSNASGGRVNPDLREYVDFKIGNVPGIYKQMTGDNKINNADASTRAMPFVWRPEAGEPWNPIGIHKMERLKRLYKIRQQMLETGQYYTDEDGNQITPLADLVEAEKNSGGDGGDSKLSPDEEALLSSVRP